MSDSIALSRSDQDYAAAYAGSLPTGAAWPRDPTSVLMRLVLGLAGPWADVDAAAADFVNVESDPRITSAMLVDWEHAFGLPDPCSSESPTLEDRRRALVQKIATEGGQSRAFFTAVAAALGYTITITEHSPLMCGVSSIGDGGSECAPPEMRFVWNINVSDTRLTWFRVGLGQCGIDPLLRISLATDLYCIFHRWKPAHTDIFFTYSPGSTDIYSGIEPAGDAPLLDFSLPDSQYIPLL